MKARLVGKLGPEAILWLRAWARAQPLAAVTKSSYVDGRLEAWYRLGSNLQSVAAGRASLFAAEEPPPRLAAFGDAHLPGWRSLLLCGGRTSISPHRDHGHFEAEALMVNLGEAEFLEHDHLGNAEGSLVLSDGAVVRLDVKVLHSSVQRSEERFHVTFRRVRPAFLSGQLSLSGLGNA